MPPEWPLSRSLRKLIPSPSAFSSGPVVPRRLGHGPRLLLALLDDGPFPASMAEIGSVLGVSFRTAGRWRDVLFAEGVVDVRDGQLELDGARLTELRHEAGCPRRAPAARPPPRRPVPVRGCWHPLCCTLTSSVSRDGTGQRQMKKLGNMVEPLS